LTEFRSQKSEVRRRDNARRGLESAIRSVCCEQSYDQPQFQRLADLQMDTDNEMTSWQCYVFARNISELCKSLICRHSLKNAGEVVLAVFFIGECDFDSMGVDLSGRNFAKTTAKDSGVFVFIPVSI
jgi:hypothetical protein